VSLASRLAAAIDQRRREFVQRAAAVLRLALEPAAPAPRRRRRRRPPAACTKTATFVQEPGEVLVDQVDVTEQLEDTARKARALVDQLEREQTSAPAAEDLAGPGELAEDLDEVSVLPARRTESPALLRRALRRLPVVSDDVDAFRPATRDQCRGVPRPCPFVSCSHHLYLDVNPENGSIKYNQPHLEVWELAESCSLDVADRGGITLEELGAILDLTRERIRQIEVRGLTKIRTHAGVELGLPSEQE
jgi:hypothetical protein